jgi:hypothetical protein
MKRFFAMPLVALTFAAFVSQAAAKTARPISVGSWTGSWTCVAGKDKYTETFAPMLNGKAMRVVITGPFASEGIAVYDKARKAWFYAYINADGTYSANTGPVSGANIAFKQVFPAGIAVDTIAMNSATKYTSSFTMVANKKKVTSVEACTKN